MARALWPHDTMKSWLPPLHRLQVWMQLELATTASLRRVRRLVVQALGPAGAGPDAIVKPEFDRHIEAMLQEEEAGGVEVRVCGVRPLG